VLYEVPGLAEEIMLVAPGVTLGWGIDRNFSGDLISDISVKTTASVRIAASEPQDLDWFLAQLGKITTLLSLMAGSPMAPIHLAAKTSADEEVEVLVALKESTQCAFRRGHEFFLVRDTMGATLDDVFSRWFAKYDAIETPSQLALSVLNSESLWLHVEFLSLMQALEGFHRAIQPDAVYATDAAYKEVERALYAAIPSSVGEDHRKALKSRIKYGNQISLRKRLDVLAQRLLPSIRSKLFGGSNKVPKGWVETRNYFTHWDQESREDVLDPLQIHRASARMRLWIRVLYLDLVGIPSEKIEAALDFANKESQYLIQLNSMERRRTEPDQSAMSMQLKDTEEPPSAEDFPPAEDAPREA
jgi:hypothetical protein